MEKIRVIANSKIYEIDGDSTLETFAKAAGLNPRRCVAELNGYAVRAADFPKKRLCDGDKIELMEIVAGG